jgi:hypothetical protein
MYKLHRILISLTHLSMITIVLAKGLLNNKAGFLKPLIYAGFCHHPNTFKVLG